MCGIVLAAAVGCKSLIDDQNLIDQTFCSVKGAMIFETVPARIIQGGCKAWLARSSAIYMVSRESKTPQLNSCSLSAIAVEAFMNNAG